MSYDTICYNLFAYQIQNDQVNIKHQYFTKVIWKAEIAFE